MALVAVLILLLSATTAVINGLESFGLCVIDCTSQCDFINCPFNFYGNCLSNCAAALAAAEASFTSTTDLEPGTTSPENSNNAASIDTPAGSAVDTSGADTSGADTSGADTSGADTSGADTSGADTSGADTSGADTPSDSSQPTNSDNNVQIIMQPDTDQSRITVNSKTYSLDDLLAGNVGQGLRVVNLRGSHSGSQSTLQTSPSDNTDTNGATNVDGGEDIRVINFGGTSSGSQSTLQTSPSENTDTNGATNVDDGQGTRVINFGTSLLSQSTLQALLSGINKNGGMNADDGTQSADFPGSDNLQTGIADNNGVRVIEF